MLNKTLVIDLFVALSMTAGDAAEECRVMKATKDAGGQSLLDDGYRLAYTDRDGSSLYQKGDDRIMLVPAEVTAPDMVWAVQRHSDLMSISRKLATQKNYKKPRLQPQEGITFLHKPSNKLILFVCRDRDVFKDPE